MHEFLGFCVLILRTQQSEEKGKKMHSEAGNKTSRECNQNNQTLSKGQCDSYRADIALPEPTVGRKQKPQLQCPLWLSTWQDYQLTIEADFFSLLLI